MRVRGILAVAALWLTSTLHAQQAPPAVGLQRPILPATVEADRKITFRLSAPTAIGVQVFLPNLSPNAHDMSRGPDGVWSATLGPFDPEIYSYAFQIGGARVNAGQVEVPGNPPRDYEVQDVPRGAYTIHAYYSEVQKRRRGMIVYVPPQYAAEPNRRFPVLYLFAGMLETDWTQSGRAHLIYDNLIAQRRAVPAIIVMPNNTVGPEPVPALQNAAIMEQELLTVIMPLVERTYRTVNERSQRAIAGVSFGGGTAFTLGMRQLDKFAYVAEFATGAFGGAERTAYAPGYVDYDPAKIVPDMYAKLTATATKPRVFYMSVGTEDTRAPFHRKVLEDFKNNGVTPVFKTFPGGHEWKVFRNSLADVAPLLFK